MQENENVVKPLCNTVKRKRKRKYPVIREAFCRRTDTGEIIYLNCNTNKKINTFLRSTFLN